MIVRHPNIKVNELFGFMFLVFQMSTGWRENMKGMGVWIVFKAV